GSMALPGGTEHCANISIAIEQSNDVHKKPVGLSHTSGWVEDEQQTLLQGSQTSHKESPLLLYDEERLAIFYRTNWFPSIAGCNGIVNILFHPWASSSMRRLIRHNSCIMGSGMWV